MVEVVVGRTVRDIAAFHIRASGNLEPQPAGLIAGGGKRVHLCFHDERMTQLTQRQLPNNCIYLGGPFGVTCRLWIVCERVFGALFGPFGWVGTAALNFAYKGFQKTQRCSLSANNKTLLFHIISAEGCHLNVICHLHVPLVRRQDLVHRVLSVFVLSLEGCLFEF